MNPENSRIMNRLMPNSRLVILRGGAGGHLAIIERADDYNELVLSFMNEVLRGGSFKPSKEAEVI